MTIHYVDSAASGTDAGTSWTNAWATLLQSAGVAADDTVLVDDGHSETNTTALVIDWANATYVAPIKVICVDNADDSLSTGAVVQRTGAGDITLRAGGGKVHINGVTFDTGDNLTFGGGDDIIVLENCTALVTDLLSACGGVSGTTEFLNCTLDNADTGLTPMVANGRGTKSIFRGCTFDASGGTPTGNFIGPKVDGEAWLFEDCDLSARGANLCTIDAITGGNGNSVTFRRCKLPTSYELVNGTLVNPSVYLLESCDSGTISDPELGITELETLWGTVKTVLTERRTGGAQDGEQANEHSWQMVSNANTEEVFSALVSPPIVHWVDPDATPSGATAMGLAQSSRMAPQGTPVELTTDSSSAWTGSGVGIKQKIDFPIGDYTLTLYVASGVTLNDDDFWAEISAPDQVGGPVVVRCFLALETTVSVDPKLEIV